MVLLARKDEEGNTQALYDHLHGAGRLASGFEDEFADISRTAAVLHDVGKVAQQFQTYLLSDDGHRGDVQHARQGAFVVNDFFESKGEIEEIAKEILELAISKHHGGLPDCIDESGNRAFLLGFTESDKSNEKYAYQEIKRGLNGLALDLQSNFRGSAEDIACFLKKIKSLRLSKDSIYFYLGLLVKLIYSRLVDADRTDAACFETRKQYRPNAVDWQNLISRLDKSMRSFDSSSEINRIRHQINEQCCLAGARETGIYRLSIPTGGGKTLASLNFALHHALKTGKRRIIYVIPYLSITTQTAKTFRDVLGLNSDSDVLLEHYSTAGMQRSADVADNASSEFEDAGEHQRKLAAERWDNPIIVTTMVEFLETVMSARGTKLRKFHNMADSVIIFDEIQSLPMNTINLFNEIVSFLSKITNSTILLCSATQPLLKKSIVEGAERVNVVQYEGAPSFTDIINCACDTSDRSSKSYKRFAKDVKERLIECMFGGAQFPMSILNAACHKVTRPMGYDNIRVWRRDFEIACSLWKKHYIDETRKQHRQEDVITMYLEPNRDDRDYLYGRLLALADNFEESVLRKQGVKDRPTNAIKLMSNFTAKPYTTWGTLWKQLTPYLKSANGGSWFRNEVDDVMALFKEGDFEDNKALSPMFLLGYSCQRRASRRKAQEISQKNNSNN